jgi:hypothetical protein
VPPEGNLSQVVRLIHLNGPPGIGKSTIASAFADRHPGVLNLDIDRVAAMIGGCRENFSESFDAGRLLATAMARAHLASGHDVIMPQMMTHVNADELADFEAAQQRLKRSISRYCSLQMSSPQSSVAWKGRKPVIHRMPSASSSTTRADRISCGCSTRKSLISLPTGSRTR